MSGVATISAHDTVRVHRLFRVLGGTTPTAAEENWGGGLPWVTPVDLGPVHGGTVTNTDRTVTSTAVATSSLRKVPAGSIILSCRAPIGYVATAGVPLTFNQGCKALVPHQPLDERYFRYVLQAAGQDLQARGRGSTFLELGTQDLAEMPIPAPPVEVQRRIADFLDAETARIGELLEKNERVRSLLAERHASFLEQLCWMDDASRVPLAYVCDARRPIRYGIVLPGPSVDDGVPLIKAGDVHAGTLEVGTKSRVAREVEARHSKSRVQPGDLVYTIRGSYGDVAVVPANLPVANLTQDVARLAPNSVDGAWLALVLAAPSARSYAATVARGATISGVNIEDLRSIRVPVPTVEEQRTRVARAQAVLERIDAVIDCTQAQDALLGERREALITAAVTGELEVWGDGDG